jgi:site-specific recombinase XerD
LNLDLFDTPDAQARRERLALTFDRWAANRSASRFGLREESIEVYRDMWGVFAAWCADRDCETATVDECDLEHFLRSLGRHGQATKRYGRRMLQLLARIDRFDAEEAGRGPNPAFARLKQHPDWRFADSELEEPLPEFLAAAEAKALIAFVTVRQSSSDALTWQELRNRSAVALQLGGGITPGETRTLTLDQVVISGGRVKGEPWALALPGNGNFPARQTPLASWAGRQLGLWLRVRANQAIPGQMVFPSTRTGKEWSKASSINAFRDVLERAGIANPAGGSFKLRHTFALRQLTKHSSEEVASWLGVQDPAVMDRYKRVLTTPVDLV